MIRGPRRGRAPRGRAARPTAPRPRRPRPAPARAGRAGCRRSRSSSPSRPGARGGAPTCAPPAQRADPRAGSAATSSGACAPRPIPQRRAGPACRGSGSTRRACRCRAAARRGRGRAGSPRRGRAGARAPPRCGRRRRSAGGVGRLRVHHRREGRRHAVEPLPVGVADAVARLPRAHVGLLERGPEALVVLERAELATSAGSNQVPLRSRATRRRPPPRRATRTPRPSARCRGCGRAPGSASPATPAGWPRPSQCSSSARIASAVASSMPTSRATSAPRSQRSAINARWPSEPCATTARMCRTLVSAEAPGAVLRSRWRSDCPAAGCPSSSGPA